MFRVLHSYASTPFVNSVFVSSSRERGYRPIPLQNSCHTICRPHSHCPQFQKPRSCDCPCTPSANIDGITHRLLLAYHWSKAYTYLHCSSKNLRWPSNTLKHGPNRRNVRHYHSFAIQLQPDSGIVSRRAALKLVNVNDGLTVHQRRGQSNVLKTARIR